MIYAGMSPETSGDEISSIRYVCASATDQNAYFPRRSTDSNRPFTKWSASCSSPTSTTETAFATAASLSTVSSAQVRGASGRSRSDTSTVYPPHARYLPGASSFTYFPFLKRNPRCVSLMTIFFILCITSRKYLRVHLRRAATVREDAEKRTLKSVPLGLLTVQLRM